MNIEEKITYTIPEVLELWGPEAKEYIPGVFKTLSKAMMRFYDLQKTPEVKEYEYIKERANVYRALLKALMRGHYNSKSTSESRFKILERDKFTCQYCGRKPPEVELEVDHKLPRARGGLDNTDNLIAACRQCNREKRDKYDTSYVNPEE